VTFWGYPVINDFLVAYWKNEERRLLNFTAYTARIMSEMIYFWSDRLGNDAFTKATLWGESRRYFFMD
jgi:hypothetical protein